MFRHSPAERRVLHVGISLKALLVGDVEPEVDFREEVRCCILNQKKIRNIRRFSVLPSSRLIEMLGMWL